MFPGSISNSFRFRRLVFDRALARGVQCTLSYAFNETDIKETAMHNEERYPELQVDGAWARLDPVCEAGSSTEPGMVNDPVETANHIDRIAQRSSGWFRSY